MNHEIKLWKNVGAVEPTCPCGWSGGDQPTEYDAELVGARHLAAMYPRPAALPASSEPVPLADVLPVVTLAPCTRPPPGWRCTRDAKHTGPCAALPIAPEPLTADELDQIHHALGVAMHEGMVSDEAAAFRLRAKVAALEAYLRSVPS